MDAAMVEKPLASEFSQESSVNDSDETKKVIILGREVDLPSDVADTVQDLLDRADEVRAKQLLSEEQMGKNKDVDINQPGISPQVKVEQQTPDGRAAGGKVGAKPGTQTGGGTQKTDEEKEKDKKDAEEEQKKKDAEEAEKKKDEENEDADEDDKKKDADMANLKKDMDEKEAKHDAEMAEMKKKMDDFANKTMNGGEKKEDSIDLNTRIRARAKLERQAAKIVPSSVEKKFDSMSDKEIYAAVIKHGSPNADLEGKSKTYLESRFDSIVEKQAEEGSKKVRTDMGKAALGIGGRMDSQERADADPEGARNKMIANSRTLYQQPLSKSKAK
jgi:hypothetical protein